MRTENEFFDRQGPLEGQFWLVTSMPGMGKSTLLRNLAVRVTKNLRGNGGKGRSIYWNAEDPVLHWKERMHCIEPESDHLDIEYTEDPDSILKRPLNTKIMVIDGLEFLLREELHLGEEYAWRTRGLLYLCQYFRRYAEQQKTFVLASFGLRRGITSGASPSYTFSSDALLRPHIMSSEDQEMSVRFVKGKSVEDVGRFQLQHGRMIPLDSRLHLP